MSRLLALFIFLLAATSAASNALNVSSGAYKLTDIIEDSMSYKGSVCAAFKDNSGNDREADPRCGQELFVVRSNSHDQLAFFEAPPQHGLKGLKTFDLFHGAILRRNRQCEGYAEVPVEGIFQSRLCRAFRATKTTTPLKETYLFVPNMLPAPLEDMDPTSDAIAHAIVVGGLIGLPMGFSSADVITIEKQNELPNQIVIENLKVQIVIMVKSTIKRRFILTRVNQ